MKKDEIYRIVKVTICFSVFIVAVQYLRGVEFKTLEDIKKILSWSLTIIPIFWIFYFKYGWKISILNKIILYKENINGTWFGHYTSKDLTKNREYKGQIVLIIKQSYLRIKVKSTTVRKTKMHSYVAELSKDYDLDRLIYVYYQDDESPVDHSTKKGAADLELTMDTKKPILSGKFWTNVGTLGHMEVKRFTKKHITEFNEAKEKYKECDY